MSGRCRDVKLPQSLVLHIPTSTKKKKIKQETHSFHLLLKNKEEFNTNVLINTSIYDPEQKAGLKHSADTGLAAVVSGPGPGSKKIRMLMQ